MTGAITTTILGKTIHLFPVEGDDPQLYRARYLDEEAGEIRDFGIVRRTVTTKIPCDETEKTSTKTVSPPKGAEEKEEDRMECWNCWGRGRIHRSYTLSGKQEVVKCDLCHGRGDIPSRKLAYASTDEDSLPPPPTGRATHRRSKKQRTLRMRADNH
jgi:hypothetical protein